MGISENIIDFNSTKPLLIILKNSILAITFCNGRFEGIFNQE